MIAYSFPPEGNAGTYRPLRFSRYLLGKGWLPTVVCAEKPSYERFDLELLATVPAEIEVIRVRGRDPWQWIQTKRAARAQGLHPVAAQTAPACQPEASQSRFRQEARRAVRCLERWSYHPDFAMGWIRPAVSTIIKMCRTRRPDVIWATGAPWSSFVVAQRVSRLLGVPYVLDFRSSWTLVPDEFESMRPQWAQRRDRRTLRELFQGAQAAVFFYETEAGCFWQAYRGGLNPSKIHVIPNGFEGCVEPFGHAEGDKCRILYGGTLSSYRYDTLVEALRLLKERDSEKARLLQVEFVGENNASLLRELSTLGLSDTVTISPPVSHTEIMRRQREAHALLVLERKPSHKGYEILAGAKLFGYLKAGRPIVGVLPEGEAARILRQVGVSTVASADSAVEIAAVLDQIVDAWSNRSLSSLTPEPAACMEFSGENQTEALVRALEGKPALKSSIPGRLDIPPSLKSDLEDPNWLPEPAGL